jgi:hypothetical protein
MSFCLQAKSSEGRPPQPKIVQKTRDCNRFESQIILYISWRPTLATDKNFPVCVVEGLSS